MIIKPSIAVIDSDAPTLAETIRVLRVSDFIAKGFASAEEFLASNRAALTTCLIADLHLPGISGLELYGRLSALGKPVPTILTTAYPHDGMRQRTLSVGIAGYLAKPFNQQDLLASIRLATRRGASSTQ